MEENCKLKEFLETSRSALEASREETKALKYKNKSIDAGFRKRDQELLQCTETRKKIMKLILSKG